MELPEDDLPPNNMNAHQLVPGEFAKSVEAFRDRLQYRAGHRRFPQFERLAEPRWSLLNNGERKSRHQRHAPLFALRDGLLVESVETETQQPRHNPRYLAFRDLRCEVTGRDISTKTEWLPT
jgi:hypothetical protein